MFLVQRMFDKGLINVQLGVLAFRRERTIMCRHNLSYSINKVLICQGYWTIGWLVHMTTWGYTERWIVVRHFRWKEVPKSCACLLITSDVLIFGYHRFRVVWRVIEDAIVWVVQVNNEFHWCFHFLKYRHCDTCRRLGHSDFNWVQQPWEMFLMLQFWWLGHFQSSCHSRCLRLFLLGECKLWESVRAHSGPSSVPVLLHWWRDDFRFNKLSLLRWNSLVYSQFYRSFVFNKCRWIEVCRT